MSEDTNPETMDDLTDKSAENRSREEITRRQRTRLAVRPPDDDEEIHLLAALGDYSRRRDLYRDIEDDRAWLRRYPLAQHYGVEAEEQVSRHIEAGERGGGTEEK